MLIAMRVFQSLEEEEGDLVCDAINIINPELFGARAWVVDKMVDLLVDSVVRFETTLTSAGKGELQVSMFQPRRPAMHRPWTLWRP